MRYSLILSVFVHLNHFQVFVASILEEARKIPKIAPTGERYQDSTGSNKHEIIKSIESIKRRLFEPGGREHVITVECDGGKT